MIYQVMLQTPHGWALFRQPTHDAHEARQLARLAAATLPGMRALILSAATEAELEECCALWQSTQPGRLSGALTSATPCTADSTMPGDWHSRRSALEMGPGGDHDKPYTYQSPADWHVAAAWLQLQARVTRGEMGGARDGAGQRGTDVGEVACAA